MHQGVIEGGHYWCTVKESGKWYELDDDKVKELNSEEFRRTLRAGSSNAYILFYSSLYS
jgi:ubiquitin C-terminal hydrolase